MFFKVKFSSNMVQHIAFFLFDVSPFRCLIFDLYVLVFNTSLLPLNYVWCSKSHVGLCSRPIGCCDGPTLFLTDCAKTE